MPGLIGRCGGGITEITSVDGSVTITNPTGPIVDLHVAGGGGGGLAFSTDPQTGSWLGIETNSVHTFTSGGTAGMMLHAKDHSLRLRASSGTATADIELQTGGVLASMGGFTVEVDDVQGTQWIQVGGDFLVNLFSAGLKFHVTSPALLGQEVFQVRSDGSIHGRAAVGAITWDL